MKEKYHVLMEKVKLNIEKNKNTFNMFIKKCFTENRNEAILVCHGGTIGTILEIFYDDSKNFYEHQPTCGRGYKINLEQINNKLEIINIDNI